MTFDSTLHGVNQSHRERHIWYHLWICLNILCCMFIRRLWFSLETATLCAGPVQPPRGWLWRQSIISNGSGSHNGGTLWDLFGMHCGRQKGSLIFGRMFTGVCHVWKVIGSLTFPSRNHLRIYISSLGEKQMNIIESLLSLQLHHMLLTTHREHHCHYYCDTIVSKINGQLALCVCMYKCASMCLE